MNTKISFLSSIGDFFRELFSISDPGEQNFGPYSDKPKYIIASRMVTEAKNPTEYESQFLHQMYAAKMQEYGVKKFFDDRVIQLVEIPVSVNASHFFRTEHERRMRVIRHIRSRQLRNGTRDSDPQGTISSFNTFVSSSNSVLTHRDGSVTWAVPALRPTKYR